MVSVCFVTNELYPLKPGGIGRLMYNFAVDNLEAPDPADLHFLLPSEGEEQRKAIREAFLGLGTVHFCSGEYTTLGVFGESLRRFGTGADGQRPNNLDEHLLRSLQYYSGLQEAQVAAGKQFDIVEFPDFGGWAVAALAAKRSGLAFANTRIAVRLHSTFGLITLAERYYHRPSLWLSAIYDMERRALEDADLVVGHLESIADHNARSYSFTDDWRSKVITEFPPITLDEPVGVGARVVARRPARDFIFSSRLQPFKCPDLFVRAAVRMLRDDPACTSTFHVVSYGWDQAYIQWLQSLVPLDLRMRIRFILSYTQEERSQLLRRSIVVIPSIYESLCLFAYESAMQGLKVILNRQCDAFGAGPRWNDRGNCLMFDGSYLDLARVMREALDWTPTTMVNAAPDPPYWESFEPLDALPRNHAPAPAVDLLVYGFTSIADLNQRLIIANERQVGAGWPSSQIDQCHLIAPRPMLRAAGLPARIPDVPGVHLHLVEGWDVTADDISAAIEQMASELVAFAPVDMAIDPAFLEAALGALASDPDLAAVTSHTLVIDPEHEGPPRVRLYAADLLTAAAATTRVCHRASVFRRSAIQRVGLRMDGGDRWFEDLCGRLVDTGHRIVCLPAAPVREPLQRPYSRISDELFFSTRANDLGLAAHQPYMFGSLSHVQVGDFRIGEAPVPEHRPHRPTAPATWLDVNFERSEIIAANGGDRDRYRDIGLRVSNLDIKGRSWDAIQFKLGIFDHLPEISFRDQRAAIFDHWPAERVDARGPLIEYCPRTHEAKGAAVAEAIMTLSPDDRRYLGALLRTLPAIVQSAETLKGTNLSAWISAAETLRDHWEGEGWE